MIEGEQDSVPGYRTRHRPFSVVERL